MLYATLVPSGDHVTLPQLSDILCNPVPSEFITNSPSCPLILLPKAIFVPSGDMTGGPHNSSPPPVNFLRSLPSELMLEMVKVELFVVVLYIEVAKIILLFPSVDVA